MTATTAARSTTVARPRNNRRKPGVPGRGAGTRVGAAPVLALALALARVALAAYPTVIHDDQSALVCGPGDYQAVQSSADAVAMGVPVAVLGLATDAGLALLGGPPSCRGSAASSSPPT